MLMGSSDEDPATGPLPTAVVMGGSIMRLAGWGILGLSLLWLLPNFPQKPILLLFGLGIYYFPVLGAAVLAIRLGRRAGTGRRYAAYTGSVLSIILCGAIALLLFSVPRWASDDILDLGFWAPNTVLRWLGAIVLVAIAVALLSSGGLLMSAASRRALAADRQRLRGSEIVEVVVVVLIAVLFVVASIPAAGAS